MMIQFLFFTCVTVLYFFFKLHCFSNQLDFECVVVFFVFLQYIKNCKAVVDGFQTTDLLVFQKSCFIKLYLTR